MKCLRALTAGVLNQVKIRSLWTVCSKCVRGRGTHKGLLRHGHGQTQSVCGRRALPSHSILAGGSAPQPPAAADRLRSEQVCLGVPGPSACSAREQTARKPWKTFCGISSIFVFLAHKAGRFGAPPSMHWICGWDLQVARGRYYKARHCCPGNSGADLFGPVLHLQVDSLDIRNGVGGREGSGFTAQFPLRAITMTLIFMTLNFVTFRSRFQMALNAACYLALGRFFIYIFTMTLGPKLFKRSSLSVITYHFTNNRPFL